MLTHKIVWKFRYFHSRLFTKNSVKTTFLLMASSFVCLASNFEFELSHYHADLLGECGVDFQSAMTRI